MDKISSLLAVLFFLMAPVATAQPATPHGQPGHKPATSITHEAQQVIESVIGKRAKNITLQAISSPNGRDTYQINARNGHLTIRGSSTIALTFGFNQYLQKACHSMVTWSGKHLSLPARWPDYSTKRLTSPYKYRYYLNVVTFGYNTVYWSWQRWKKELNWMALHGMNMPLALVGTEAIEARVWKKLGLSQNAIDHYFTGPAYLPWNRMGNIDGWDGPLPDSWLQHQITLEHKILHRMHRLGMTPIVPAFGGFVPRQLAKTHPGVKIRELRWGGFSKQYHAYILSPNSDYFKKIGKLFIQQWEKEFGSAKFFLSDSFNEMRPPVPKNNPAKKNRIMADYGKSIYRSIVAGDSSAVWVTQGWAFGSARKFWSPQTLQAFLSKVPNDKMVILNLFPRGGWQGTPIWKRQKGYYGKRWVYSTIPNFGRKTPWTGDLSRYVSISTNVLKSPYSRHLIGFGFAPEGIENNEVIYELLADMGWRDQKINLKTWIPAYCRARYGGYPKQMARAWQQLQQSAYGPVTPHHKFAWQVAHPNPKRKGSVVDSVAVFKSAVKHFLACSGQLKKSKLYRNDAVLLAAMYLGVRADQYYTKALQAQAAGHKRQKQAAEDNVIRLLDGANRLMASHPGDRLSRWLQQARSRGQTLAEKHHFEEDAKRQITTWGGDIDDYAAKMWSGLIKEYYIPRVKMILAGKSSKLKAWEEQWVERTGPVKKTKPYPHPVDKAKQFLNHF